MDVSVRVSRFGVPGYPPRRMLPKQGRFNSVTSAYIREMPDSVKEYRSLACPKR